MKSRGLKVCKQAKGGLSLSVVLLFILPVILDSCKKKDNQDQVVFPQTVYAHDLVVTSAIRMFTGNGEINDTAVINRYVKGLPYFNLSSVNISDYLSFVSADSVVVSAHTDKFSYTLNNGLFLLYSPTYFQFDPANHLARLCDTLLKYKSPIVLVPAGTNLLYWARKAVWVAYGNYQELTTPGLGYKVSSYQGYQAGTLPNEFFEGSAAALRPGDTMAVQSYSMHMLPK